MSKFGIDQRELTAAAKKLRELGKKLPAKERKKILRKAAKPLVKAARSNIPQSAEPHKVYDTKKVSGKLKAPKGLGKVKATIYPGNLRKSIRPKSLRKSPDIFVGPVKPKKLQGEYGRGRRVAGYYAHWLEFGNKHIQGIGYMRRAVDSTKQTVVKEITGGIKKRITDFLRKNGINA